MITQTHKKEENGILFFKPEIDQNHGDYNAKALDTLYQLEKKHFWFIIRKQWILRYFNEFVDRKCSVLEVGGGTGFVARNLQEEGYDISMGDIHANGLRYAREYGVKQCYQFDLLAPPFEKHFDVVAMFDVLEHLSDDVQALEKVRKILKREGKLVLTLPAHQFLWSYLDEKAGHKRRYSLKTIEALLQKTGFKIIKGRYIFLSLFPLLAVRSLMNQNKPKEETITSGFQLNPILNTILLKLCDLEYRIGSFIPNIIGGSILLVAQIDDGV